MEKALMDAASGNDCSANGDSGQCTSVWASVCRHKGINTRKIIIKIINYYSLL